MENQLIFQKTYYVVNMHVFFLDISCAVITCDNDENFDKGDDCSKDVENDSHHVPFTPRKVIWILKWKVGSKGKLFKGNYEAKREFPEG